MIKFPESFTHKEKILLDLEVYRKLNLDLLETLSKENLNNQEIQNMWPIKKHFLHLAKIQDCYTKALKEKKIIFDSEVVEEGFQTKDQIKAELERANKDFQDTNSDIKIDWFGESWTLEAHLQALVDHEILHQGIFISYVRQLKLNFPKSWQLWGFS